MTKRRKQIIQIIQFCSINIRIDQGKEIKKIPEEEDTEAEEEESIVSEDTVAGETSTEETTKIRGRR